MKMKRKMSRKLAATTTVAASAIVLISSANGDVKGRSR